MKKVIIALPTGNIVVSSNSHDAEGIKKVILNRHEVATNYCKLHGWHTDPTQLSFEQILEIRKTKEWIEVGK